MKILIYIYFLYLIKYLKNTVWTITSLIFCSGCSKAFELLTKVLKDNGNEPSKW